MIAYFSLDRWPEAIEAVQHIVLSGRMAGGEGRVHGAQVSVAPPKQLPEPEPAGEWWTRPRGPIPAG